jgi:hypothetical protein
MIEQKVEGFNFADFNWGLSNAIPATLSFWVRSSLTGQFDVSVRSHNDSRCYPTTYTINAANTWEYKTITFPGDTTGTWLKNNLAGVRLLFGLGLGSSYQSTAPNTWQAGTKLGITGSQSVVGTNGATLDITGIQLEKGTVVTSFDYRPYNTELALCQRYYWRKNDTTGYWSPATQRSTTQSEIAIQHPVQMRANPTLGYSGTWTIGFWGTGSTVSSFVFNVVGALVCDVQANHGSGGSAGRAVEIYAGTGGYMDFNSEL